MNQNEPIFLNLYIRDTESYRKNTKIVGNKQIMRVKKLISFYENQHYFTILFVHNFLSRWLNESFRFFCISYIKILEKGSFWFILQNPSFYSFLQLIGLPVFWRWHLLPVPPHHQLPQADNWWENQRWQIPLIQLPLNEQRGTTSLWSFPFVRCIHSDYITWLAKWLCMQIQWLDIIIRFMYPIAHIIR